MSDIFIQGETLQIGKKVDYVEIQGVNETVESLSPKIVAGGGGDNKDWLLDPNWLDSLYNGFNYNNNDLYGGYDFFGCRFLSQYEYYTPLITRNNEKMIHQNHSANVQFFFVKMIDYKKIKRIDIDIEVYSNVDRQYNMTNVRLASTPNITDHTFGINGTVFRQFDLNNFESSIQAINSQPYLTIHSTDKYRLARQIVSIDVEGLVNDGIITSNFYWGTHRCDCGIYLRSIELVH